MNNQLCFNLLLCEEGAQYCLKELTFPLSKKSSDSGDAGDKIKEEDHYKCLKWEGSFSSTFQVPWGRLMSV